MLSKRSLFIQNNWITGKDTLFTSINPSNDQINWHGNSASLEQITFAIQSAKAVQQKWWESGFTARCQVLKRYQSQLEKNKRWLAELIKKETGKPMWESLQEVQGMIQKIPVSIQAYQERCAEKVRELAGDKFNKTQFKALGVIAILGPFNFPGHIPQGQIVPALLAGNSVVFKPSDKCPLVALAMMHLWQQADPPSGILNCVQGGARVAQVLVVQNTVNAVFLTGSEQVGRDIHHFFAGNYKKLLALELGGNNAIVLTQTKQQQAAIDCIIQSAFATAGQRCTCARRLVIVKNSANRRLLTNLIKQVKRLKIGSRYSQALMGPVISKQSREVLLQKQQQYIGLGAKVLLKMKSVGLKGAYLSPGILDASHLSHCEDEELFGPLLQVRWVDDLDQAIFEANQSRFGLSATLLSNDKKEFDYFYKHINAGVINWNCPSTGASGLAPFCGVGASGNHRAAGYFMVDSCVQPIASTQSNSLVRNDIAKNWFKKS
eukprot:COSAG01_NODE_941_length_12576_cov_118.998557_4_plen_491_part_00